MAINLRFDLKNLPDIALATRLQQILDGAEAARAIAKPISLFWSSRGPVRHPWFYPFTSFLGYRWSGLFASQVGLAFGCSLQSLVPWASRMRALMAVHLALCEALDISDEIDRRRANGSCPGEWCRSCG
jgi:hypothetical protein